MKKNFSQVEWLFSSVNQNEYITEIWERRIAIAAMSGAINWSNMIDRQAREINKRNRLYAPLLERVY